MKQAIRKSEAAKMKFYTYVHVEDGAVVINALDRSNWNPKCSI